MKKLNFTLFLILLIGSVALAQQTSFTDASQSKPTKIKLTYTYNQGIPPNLYSDVRFQDNNNNNVLEAKEECRFTIAITNKGIGPAQEVTVTISDSCKDPAIIFLDNNKIIPIIYPGKTETVILRIYAGMDIRSADNKFTIKMVERDGFDCDPVSVYLTTLQFQEPKLVVAGLEINDACKECNTIKEDRKFQAGEMVMVKITVQNQGQNISEGTSFSVNSKDPKIKIHSADTGNLGNLEIGESREIWIKMSANKQVDTKSNLPVFLTMKNKVRRGEVNNLQLPLALDQTPQKPEIQKITPIIGKYANKRLIWDINPERTTTNTGDVDDITQITPSATRRNNAVAIIIGVENYKYEFNAYYAENDANIMEEYCKTVLGIPSNKVFKFTSDSVTGSFYINLFNPKYGKLKSLIDKGKTELFVFYSGHGIPSPDGTKVYFPPADGHFAGIMDSGFEFGKFFDYLAELGAKNTLVFLDACFSGVSRASENHKPDNLGLGKGGVTIPPSYGQPWEKNPGLTIFSSSSFNKPSFSNDKSGTGLFTYYVCLGLKGKAAQSGNTEITVAELYKYVSDQVKASNQNLGELQEPEIHGNQDFILVKY